MDGEEYLIIFEYTALETNVTKLLFLWNTGAVGKRESGVEERLIYFVLGTGRLDHLMFLGP